MTYTTADSQTVTPRVLPIFGWLRNQAFKELKALPVIVLLGVWLSRNACLFEDRFILPLQSASQSFNIFQSFPQLQAEEAPRQLVEEVIERTGAWLYFDGAAQGDPRISGAGGIVFISDSHVVKLKAGLGRGSNNFAELMALKLSLILAAERGVSRLQVFGDSLLVRNWMNGRNQLENLLLQPVLDELLAIKSSLTEVTLKHIYRERNRLADELSKGGF